MDETNAGGNNTTVVDAIPSEPNNAAPPQQEQQQQQQQQSEQAQPRESESIVNNLESLQLQDTKSSASASATSNVAPSTTSAAPAKASSEYKAGSRVRQDEDKELASAKQWMMEKKGKEGKSLYEHLVKVVSRLVEEKPQNALDILEQVSAQLKKESLTPGSYSTAKSLTDSKQFDQIIAAAKTRVKLLQAEEEEETAGGEVPDISDLAHLFEWAGVSLGSEETYLLSLSIRNLTKEQSLRSVRLFGKVLGTRGDYIIVESELENPDEEYEDQFNAQWQSSPLNPAKQDSQQEQQKDANGNDVAAAQGEEEPQLDEDGNPKIPEELQGIPPKPKQKRQPKYPQEVGEGVNRYVYWATSSVGGEWTRLPDVTPQQIQVSRQIRKLCSGNLSAQVNTYPVFPGVEAHYLRAQIARIAAATVISPAGYYTVDEENSPADSDKPTLQAIIINPEYDGATPSTLLDPANWVHHMPYILPQGRTTFADPFARGEDEEEEEVDEDVDGGSESGRAAEEAPESVPEESRPVLSSLSDDNQLSASISAWSAHLASTLQPVKYSPVFLRSQLWPGAVAAAYNDKFANLYIGNGLKALPVESVSGDATMPGFYQIPALSAVQSEYAGDALVEGVDPSAEEEKSFEEMIRKSKEGDGNENGDNNNNDDDDENGNNNNNDANEDDENEDEEN